MTAEPGECAEPEQQLGEAIFASMLALETGQAINLAQVLARYPQFAREVAEFFAGADVIARVTAPLRPALAQPPNLAETPPPLGGEPTQQVPPAPLPQVQGYEVQEEIAHGGMGVVYKARQLALNREVALKMIRAGRRVSPDDMQRLRQEAQLVAQLDHAHIVPIYEVGDHAGQPFFTMKFIDGCDLAQAMSRKPQAVPNKAQERAATQLVAQLARAVHHAHQRGILHRDLKPANILLDKDGVPYLTDFGLARRLGQALGGMADPSSSGTIVGTVAYMAPEQASGAPGVVSTLADVYGLGTILYFLLTGRPPFRGDNLLKMIQQVKETDPVRPSHSHPGVNRDLEAICLKCLQKEPTQRYASARDLAKDLERLLAGKPVQARPIGLVPKGWRWCQRNRRLAGLSVVAALLLIAVLVGSPVATVLIKRELKATQEALYREDQERQKAQDAQGEAKENFRKACATVNQMLTRVGGYLLANTPGMTKVREALLEDALTFYQGVTAAHGSDPQVRWETARAYQRVGQIYQLMGQQARAEAVFRQGIDLLQNLVAESPDHEEYRSRLAGVLGNLAAVLFRTGRHDQAEPVFRRAIGMLEALAADFPTHLQHTHEVGLHWNNWGICQGEVGHLRKQEEAFRQALKVRRQLLQQFPDQPRYRYHLAMVLNNVAGALEDQQRLAEAEPYRREAIAVNEKLVDQQPEAPEFREHLASAYTSSGIWLKKVGKPQQAEEVYRKALALLTRLAGDFPDVPAHRQKLGHAYNDLGLLRMAGKHLAEAEQADREAVTIRQKLANEAPDDPQFQCDLAGSLNNLALVRLDQGVPEEARQLAQQAIRHEQNALKTNPRNPTFRRFLANHYITLAEALIFLQKHAEAAQAAAESIKVLPESGGREYAHVAGQVACCAALAAEDTKLPEKKRHEVVDVYAKQAIGLLRQAVQKGFRDGEALKKEPAFDCIRGREDFKQLENQLSRKTP